MRHNGSIFPLHNVHGKNASSPTATERLFGIVSKIAVTLCAVTPVSHKLNAKTFQQLYIEYIKRITSSVLSCIGLNQYHIKL